MADFTEVSERCWVVRHPAYEVNLTVVGGSRGLLVVDTLDSEGALRALLPAIRRLGDAPVVAVVNTHHHHDHVLGNAAVRDAWPDATLTAHDLAAVAMADLLPAQQSDGTADAASRLVVPADTFSAARVLDLGDRAVEVLHLGRGHTAGDAVVRLPDTDTLLAGDLVESSGPPAYGEDSYPLEWPATLDLVLQLTGPGTVVVPGHGAPVDRVFVEDQRDGVGAVAETVRGLAASGVGPEEALGRAEWPFPAEGLAHAVRRAYAHLPVGSRQLPMA